MFRTLALLAALALTSFGAGSTGLAADAGSRSTPLNTASVIQLGAARLMP